MPDKKRNKERNQGRNRIEDEALPLPEAEELDEKETHDLLISEERLEKIEAEDDDVAGDLTDASLYDTQHTDGHTYDPSEAWDQGLTYTPPTDPPTLPSRTDRQGVEIAAGFAPSMEDTNPDEEDLPATVDNNDLDLEDDIYTALRMNSETAHLTNIKVQVNEGIVNLLGVVPSDDDISRVEDIVSELDGVVAVKNNLQNKL